MKIFQDKHVPPAVIAHLIIRQMKEYESCLKDKKHTDLVMLEINFEILWGHFNGASQGHPTMCGAGAVLHVNSRSYFFLKICSRKGLKHPHRVIGIVDSVEKCSSKWV